MAESPQHDPDTVLDRLLLTKSSMEILTLLNNYLQANLDFTLINETGPAHAKVFVYSLSIEKLPPPNCSTGEELVELFQARGGTIKKARQEVALKALKESPLLRDQLLLYEQHRLKHKLEKCNKYPNQKKSKHHNIDLNELLDNNNDTVPTTNNAITIPTAAAVATTTNSTAAACSHPVEQCLAGKVIINVVLEIGQKLKIPVNFECAGKSGPPHETLHRVVCTVGDVTDRIHVAAHGTGRSSRLAKHDAAGNALTLLRQQWFDDVTLHQLIHNSNHLQDESNGGKTPRKRRIIFQRQTKQQKGEMQYGEQIHPVARLLQICQSRGFAEPQFISSSCPRFSSYAFTSLGPPMPQFQVECHLEVKLLNNDCERWITHGLASNKKLAKRYAAEKMLEKLGYSVLPKCRPPSKSLLKSLPSAGDEFGEMPSHGKSVNIQDANREVFVVSRHITRRRRVVSMHSAKSPAWFYQDNNTTHHRSSTSSSSYSSSSRRRSGRSKSVSSCTSSHSSSHAGMYSEADSMPTTGGDCGTWTHWEETQDIILPDQTSAPPPADSAYQESVEEDECTTEEIVYYNEASPTVNAILSHFDQQAVIPQLFPMFPLKDFAYPSIQQVAQELLQEGVSKSIQSLFHRCSAIKNRPLKDNQQAFGESWAHMLLLATTITSQVAPLMRHYIKLRSRLTALALVFNMRCDWQVLEKENALDAQPHEEVSLRLHYYPNILLTGGSAVDRPQCVHFKANRSSHVQAAYERASFRALVYFAQGTPPHF